MLRQSWKLVYNETDVKNFDELIKFYHFVILFSFKKKLYKYGKILVRFPQRGVSLVSGCHQQYPLQKVSYSLT